MHRRSLLRRAVAVGAAGLAGCLGGGSGGGTTLTPFGNRSGTGTPGAGPGPGPTTTTFRNPAGIEPPPDPEKPSPLDRAGVREFVRATERRQAFQRIVTADTEEVSLTCKALVHRSAGDGYVLLTGCGGSATGEGGESVADTSGRPVFYYVDPDRTVRIGEARRLDRPESAAYAADDPAENVAGTGGIRLYNFTESARTFDVRVNHLGSGETAYDASHDLDATSGLVVPNVARRRGSYEVTVGAAGESIVGGWTVSRATVGRSLLTATLAPGPNLGLGPARIGEITALGPV